MKKSLRMTGIALVVSLGLSAGTASAVIDGIDFSASNNDLFGNTEVVGPFADTFSFTVPGSTPVTASVISGFDSNSMFQVAFTGFELFDSAGGPALVTGFTAGGFFATLPSFSITTGTTYDLVVTGNLLGAAPGSYAGNISISPVPEPETYAMLLVGLGLVGFAARRKKHNLN